MLFGLLSFEVLGAGIRPLACTTVIAPRLHLRDFLPNNSFGNGVLSAAELGAFPQNSRIGGHLEHSYFAGKGFSQVLHLKFYKTERRPELVPGDSINPEGWKIKELTSRPSSSPFSFFLGFFVEYKSEPAEGFIYRMSSSDMEIFASLEFDPETLEVLSVGSTDDEKFKKTLGLMWELELWRNPANQLAKRFDFDLDAFGQRKRVLKTVAKFEPQIDMTDMFFALPSKEAPLVTEFRIEGASPEAQKKWRDLFANYLGPELLMMAEDSLVNPGAAFTMDLVLGRFEELNLVLRDGSDLPAYVQWLESKYSIDGLGPAIVALRGKRQWRRVDALLTEPIRELLAIWTLEIFFRIKNHTASLMKANLIKKHEIIVPRFPFSSADSRSTVFLDLGDPIPEGYAIFTHQYFAKGSVYIDQLSLGFQLVQPDRIVNDNLLAPTNTASRGFHAYHDLAHLMGFANPVYMRMVRNLAQEIQRNRRSNPPNAGKVRRQIFLIENFKHPRQKEVNQLFDKYQVTSLWSCSSLNCVDVTLRKMPNHLEFVAELWKNRNTLIEALGGVGVGAGEIYWSMPGENHTSEISKAYFSNHLPGPVLTAETAFGYRYPGTALIYFLIRTGQLSMEDHF